ncbi:PREDICTED: low affinity immunoglobulin epsilon Fc receptor-like [Poecilia mexicana]|nr:PREDICTED: low affinity immunoglobulin epsilon Fc receptor-like [Poecilia mexicana]XP_016519410.1 PREDICTED: low affinity immunoglobulin epsilon Fc receptor-like [Poecilia formosa]XP_016519416.1 PREDICTED: low affinity immunoglobulin epsilon Fc receptor-like [Poecilia formosa]
MSYEDRVVHLLTYLRTDFRSPRSVTYTTSGPEHGPENKSNAIVELKRIFKLIWHIVLVGILSGILLAVVLIIIVEWNTNQVVITSLEQVKEEMAINTERLLEEKNWIAEQLNITKANFSILKAEYDQMWSSCNLTMLEMEINRLNGVLKRAAQSRDQYERQVRQLTNQVRTLQNNYRPMEQENRKQRSILSSKRLDYIWNLCDRTTLRCSRCLRGWKEHASRCFLLTKVDKNWENARIDCLKYKGDLAVVHNAEDQAFLTNLTFQFKKANPDITFHSAWIGLQDLVKEGVHFWVNGERIKWDVIYWRTGEPNNAIATWDTDQAGQDCVSIVPPDAVGPEGWMNSWDDITCVGKRHYICETDALILA